MNDLAEVAEDLVTYLEFHLSTATTATDPEDVAGAADAASAYFQGVGICELLLDAEVDPFCHHLIRSGRMRRWLLKRAQGKLGYPKRILKPSNTRGLFGAIAGGDWALAQDISALSGVSWDEQIEYTDDFRYARFLHACVLDEPHKALAAALAEYAAALEGEAVPRFLLCAALLDRKADAGDRARGAFEQLIAGRRAELDQLRSKSVLATDELFVPFSAVYVEGLAWLRLLARAGIELQGEFAYCPSLARADASTPVPGGTFPP